MSVVSGKDSERISLHIAKKLAGISGLTPIIIGNSGEWRCEITNKDGNKRYVIAGVRYGDIRLFKNPHGLVDHLLDAGFENIEIIRSVVNKRTKKINPQKKKAPPKSRKKRTSGKKKTKVTKKRTAARV